MAKDQTYSNAKKVFQELNTGERISALELANRIGAAVYEERKKIAAFLSQQARKGRAEKHMGEDGRMYYEKIDAAPIPRAPKPSPAKVAPKVERRRDFVSYGDIGVSIVNYIDNLKEKVAELEREKEEFKRLYEEAEQRVEEVSKSRPVAQRAIRLSKLLGE